MHKGRNIIGPRMREARLLEKPKATQKDISARLELDGIYLSESSIGKIELCIRPVTDIQLVAIAKVLKTSAAWLLGETNDLYTTSKL
ncbi:MAG: hypothetical protein RUMPE_00774 [Eubacteriales bacterium SKADARSKE-1]|nr:hypothetical protein [Eubacteriales bacterium SKADARSKE-1]MDQ5983471.1 hypothetical protein [Eubacteriales bacterium SKADARSKE-1]MDQ5983737.1 hypothetical protein [Eubacteriales bacterium SKADARSKE-1]MDQ5983747.1 hypothetical protein [Eubacteriales bacterium SKADARSKE-1]